MYPKQKEDTKISKADRLINKKRRAARLHKNQQLLELIEQESLQEFDLLYRRAN